MPIRTLQLDPAENQSYPDSSSAYPDLLYPDAAPVALTLDFATNDSFPDGPMAYPDLMYPDSGNPLVLTPEV